MAEWTPVGTIRRSPSYSIACGVCGSHDSSHIGGPIGSYPEAESLFRSWGWRKRKDGWTCPACVEGEVADGG